MGIKYEPLSDPPPSLKYVSGAPVKTQWNKMWQKGAVKRRIIFCDLSKIELPNKNYKNKDIRKA